MLLVVLLKRLREIPLQGKRQKDIDTGSHAGKEQGRNNKEDTPKGKRKAFPYLNVKGIQRSPEGGG